MQDLKNSKFKYKDFSSKLKQHKEKTHSTYFSISNETGIGMTLLFQIMNGKYKSDLSMNYACVLAEWMNDNICNYLKEKP